MTNRRVNALEFVVMPKFARIIAFIKEELDEMDREDFVRIKKTQEKKKKHKEQEDKIQAKSQEKTEVHGEETVIPETKNFSEDEDDEVFV